jgi:hypothetical protein
MFTLDVVPGRRTSPEAAIYLTDGRSGNCSSSAPRIALRSPCRPRAKCARVSKRGRPRWKPTVAHELHETGRSGADSAAPVRGQRTYPARGMTNREAPRDAATHMERGRCGDVAVQVAGSVLRRPTHDSTITVGTAFT